MAELTSGAVSSLLGLLQKEARLLGGVGSDVDFIREEMESMNSFLEHLSRTAHHAGGHDKQVRTWMKQVRDLAHDCSNCIDDYLQSGDLAVHLARGGLRRYVWWTYWLVQKMVAQHRAAMRLRELKDRVSDVGKRRLRYGVEIPPPSSSTPSQGGGVAAVAVAAAAAHDAEDDDDDTQVQVAGAAGGPDHRRRGALQPRTLEEFCAEKLASWLSSSIGQQQAEAQREEAYLIPSIAIVARDAEACAAAAQGAMGLAAAHDFEKTVSINLQEFHHAWDLPLLPQEILCYVLRECIHQQGTGQGGQAEEKNPSKALEDREETFQELWGNIDRLNIYDKINQLKIKVGEVSTTIAEAESKKTEETKRFKATAGIITLDEPLEVLRQALQLTLNKQGANKIQTSLEDTMNEAAEMLKEYMETATPQEKETAAPQLPILIQLDDIQYQDILRKVFLDSKLPQVQLETSTTNPATALGEAADHIKEILNNHKIALENHKIALDIIRELLPRQPQLPGQTGNNSEGIKANSTTAAIKETMKKVQELSWAMESSLLIKGIVDKVNDHLQHKKSLIILIDENDYISQWEEIRNALSLLTCAGDSAVIVITKNNLKAKEFCSASGEPISYSLVGMYHDIVLKITGQGENSEGGSNNSQLFRDILGKCDPDEFCMRMFSHALYANPNRSNEELLRLNGTLQVAENSMATDATKAKAKMIFKFSYKDLPREHKTCLLYLAVFPQGHSIKRSSLIERWAIEGLITKEDWPTVVRHAKRCFEALIDRQLAMSVDLSAAGKVKSCMVAGQVHEFITKIALKEHILDPRLSQLQARHFSTSSGLRLRASDTIDTIVKKLRPKYLHKLRLLKLLDLEGCDGLDKNHIKDICSMILRLKYLSIRGTDVDDLPSEINNLHELEVLDIRQTKVPERATRGLVLLKLRRLLAGQRLDTNPSTSQEIKMLPGASKRLPSAVQIPRKINKMENMEVLSNVKAFSKDGAELKEIRKLGQLRKLGVVIQNKKAHLTNLLWALSDLKECIQSLSVTILGKNTEDTPPDQKLLEAPLYNYLIRPPKVLESLSIDGFTDIVRLLTLFARGSDELSKVTLSHTLLERRNLIHIAILPKLQCLRLRRNAYKGNSLTFEKEDFPHLKNFLVEEYLQTDMIKFENGATPELEKIVLFRTNIKHLCGVGALPKLKELELKGNEFLVLLPEDRTPSAETVQHEDRTPAETAKQEDGTASAEAITRATLTFREGEFKHLKYLLVQGAILQNDIKFEGGAPELEKIVLSGTNIKSLAGVEGLEKLREIDLMGDRNLLSLFTSANHITKVTLLNTCLKKDDLQILAKKPKLCMLFLLDNSYDDTQLTFHEDEFPNLKHLTVTCLKITKISFAEKSACKLEKIIWSYIKLEYLSGIDKLPELKELEFNGESVPLQVRRDIHAHDKKLIHIKPQHQDKETE